MVIISMEDGFELIKEELQKVQRCCVAGPIFLSEL